MHQNTTKPTLIFAMRYPDSVGLVWNTVARYRDQIAALLSDVCTCVFAYPELTDTPHYTPKHCDTVALNLYTREAEATAAAAAFMQARNVKAIVYMSATAAEIPYAALKAKGIALLTSENNSYDPSARNSLAKHLAKDVMRRLFKIGLLDLHIANSWANYRFLRRFARFPKSRLRCIVNGIDTDMFQPGDRRVACTELGLDPDTVWIMCASQARPEKRIGFIFDAAERLIDRVGANRIGFFHVGGGGIIADWQAECAARGLDSVFRFEGYHANPAPYYRAASVFIHAASRESFGSVVVEAMATALPVVVTRSEGPAETVLDGVTGYMIDPDDLDGFVDAVARYVEDPKLGAQHGTAGRARAVDQYSMARQVEEFAAILRPYI